MLYPVGKIFIAQSYSIKQDIKYHNMCTPMYAIPTFINELPHLVTLLKLLQMTVKMK